ncbi:hypothetical protein CVT26_013944 [Gymnopilus dilepis]|uniref:Uncharacterized protein n=1 Tax=Gymnopilus dilepis TaxID=231916 RepID=A0A409VW46_9AGAR|nr:hypothetical protein CVT26_013944 [Gymnopilus dilepis]
MIDQVFRDFAVLEQISRHDISAAEANAISTVTRVLQAIQSVYTFSTKSKGRRRRKGFRDIGFRRLFETFSVIQKTQRGRPTVASKFPFLEERLQVLFADATPVITDPAGPLLTVQTHFNMGSIGVERILEQFGDNLDKGGQNLRRS